MTIGSDLPGWPPRQDYIHWAASPRPTCGATRPPLYYDPGWECTGRGLIVVTTWRPREAGVPVVLPKRALEIIDPEPWWDLPIRDFTGGDHVHLVVPRRPPDRARPPSNAVMISPQRGVAYSGRVAPSSLSGVWGEVGSHDR